MQVLFITGAEGFAGTYLVQHLRQRGYEVVAGVRNRARKLAFERQSGRALVCDVADAINVARAIASVRPDGVIHLAGTSRATDAAAEPLQAYQSIVTAWANVLDAVRRTVPRAKVVLASSCEVYGLAGSGGAPLSESTPIQPVTTFGALKGAAETIANTFFRNYHLNVTIARPFPYTGPEQPEAFFFGAVAQRLATWDPTTTGGELRLPDLNCQRDLLHIEDVVTAYERLLQDGQPNECYNICSGQSVTCRTIIEAMVRESGHEIRLTDLQTDSAEPTIPVLCGDNTKLRQFNWQPTRSAMDAAKELVQGLKRKAPVAATA